jgi:hypothetical protein
VSRELLERLAGATPTNNRRADGISIQIPAATAVRKQALARAYVAKMPGAVEGHGGDRQTFQVACRLVIDFDLTPEQALPLLREYNARCTPPWPDDALVHKLERALQAANEKPGEHGRLLHASREGATHAGTTRPPSADPSVNARPPFLGTVPDFIQADWLKVQPRPPVRDGKESPQRGRPAIALVGLWWLLQREVIRQKRATVWLPDIVLAQVIWGGGPRPANWRQRITGWLRKFSQWQNSLNRFETHELRECRDCDPGCPLHDHHPRVRHRHFVVTVVPATRVAPDHVVEVDLDHSFLGVLELFRFSVNGERAFDFSRASDDDPEVAAARQERIDAYKQCGRLCSVYLPVLVFGPSPRSGLTGEQRQILIALTRETTRAARSSRQDKAAIVTGGAPAARGPHRIAVCPLLEKGERYVAFNGNGRHRRRHLRGRGYSLIGKTGQGWLSRCGLAIPDDEAAKWTAVRSFLVELGSLAVPFGLVAAGWNARKRQWRSLADMIALTRTPAGRTWLNSCRLRVFTPEDYLTRWRAYFADRLGFSVIPGDGGEGDTAPPTDARSTAVESAEDLDLWMRRQGMTTKELAEAVGLSRRLVSAYRSGRRPWSRAFKASVARVLAARKAAEASGAEAS